MKARLVLAVAAMFLVASLTTGATAAPKADPSAKIVGKVKRQKNGTAKVKAHYICPEGRTGISGCQPSRRRMDRATRRFPRREADPARSSHAVCKATR